MNLPWAVRLALQARRHAGHFILVTLIHENHFGLVGSQLDSPARPDLLPLAWSVTGQTPCVVLHVYTGSSESDVGGDLKGNKLEMKKTGGARVV